MGKRKAWIWSYWFGRRRGSLSRQWTTYVMWLKNRKIFLDAKIGAGYIATGVQRTGKEPQRMWSVGQFLSARRKRMKKKNNALSLVGVKHLAPLETEVFREFMPLIEHMAITQYDDGDIRKVGRITFTSHGSVWQADVKDPDTLQEMRVSAPSFDEMMALLARLLSSEDAPWQPDMWARAQVKKSKK